MRNEAMGRAGSWTTRWLGWCVLVYSTAACTYDYSQFTVVDERTEAATEATRTEATPTGDAGGLPAADGGRDE